MHVPIMNPSKPIHATARLINGFSSEALSLPPSLLRNEISVKITTNNAEKASETAIKAGVVAAGAWRGLASPLGSTDTSWDWIS